MTSGPAWALLLLIASPLGISRSAGSIFDIFTVGRDRYVGPASGAHPDLIGWLGLFGGSVVRGFGGLVGICAFGLGGAVCQLS